MAESTRTNIAFKKPFYARIRQEAHNLGMNINEFIRFCIRQYLESKEG